MKMYVADAEECKTVDEVMEYIEDHIDVEDLYDEMLDELYEPINICGYTYSPSVAFYRTDEIAYNCSKNDSESSLLESARDDIESMEIGDCENFYGIEVEVIQDLSDAPSPKDFEKFEDFCQDCDNCIYNLNCENCEEQFEIDKNIG